MNTTTVDLRGRTHYIRECTLEDVQGHFDRMKDVIPEEEALNHIGRMQSCVDEGTAFVLTDDSCFLYYHIYQTAFAEGVAMQGTGEPMKMMALFSGIFRDIDTSTIFILFKLHTGKFISEYKSLITPTSIQRHQNIEDPLMVRVDKITDKINKLATSRGF